MNTALLTVVMAFTLFACDDRGKTTHPRWTRDVENHLAYFAGGRCIDAHAHDCDGTLGRYHVSLGGDEINSIAIAMNWTDVEDLRRQIHHALRDLVSQQVLAGIDARIAAKTASESFDVGSLSVSVSTLEHVVSTIARPGVPLEYTTSVTLIWI
jgi:hypothetical protein